MKIAELLSHPSIFLKDNSHKDAVDLNNLEVSFFSKEACRWSLYGAFQVCYAPLIDRYTWNFISHPAYNRLRMAMHPSEKTDLTSFNKTHTYEDVLQLARDAGV